MSTFLEDARIGLRLLRRNPGTSITAIATLALCIGAAAAIFTVINAVLLRPLPYPDSSSLVVLWGTEIPAGQNTAANARRMTVINSLVPARWQEAAQSFSDIAWYSAWGVNLTGHGDPERLRGAVVSSAFFKCLGLAPAQGRPLSTGDSAPGDDRVVIISHALWRDRFSSDAHITGKEVTLDGLRHTIVGVMPGRLQMWLPYLPADVDVWLPLTRGFRAGRRSMPVSVIGRLKDGVTVAHAQQEMSSLSKRLEAEGGPFRRRGADVLPLGDAITSQSRVSLLVLLGAAGCVVLVACANLAGLMLARTWARQTEFGVRSALGASASRIVRQVITEFLVIAAAGGCLGLLLAIFFARAFVALHPGGIPRLEDAKPDLTVVLFVFLISCVAGLLFGLWPALAASRANINEVVKNGAGGGSGRSMLGTPRGVLVFSEVAVAVVLVVTTGLLVRSFASIQRVDFGFDTERVQAVTIPLAPSLYSEPAQQAAFSERLLERVRAAPYIQHAAVTNSIPLVPRFAVTTTVHAPAEGTSASPGSSVLLRAVTTDYFRVIGIRLLRGRVFTNADAGRLDSVILSDSIARRLWPLGDAVGRTLTVGGERVRTVVGVVGDVKSDPLDMTRTAQEIYIPFAEEPTFLMGLIVRSAGDERAVTRALRRAVLEADPNQPIDTPMSLSTVVDTRFMSRPRFTLAIVGAFATIATMLAAIGVYSLVSYTVSQRTREIGIRMAIGATPGSIVALVCRDMGKITLAGLAAGAALALAAARVVQSLLFGIGATDLSAFAMAIGVLTVACAVATYLPARRASVRCPLAALRQQ